MLYFINSTLFSYAQIFFCNRKWFGLAVMAATLINPAIGLCALAGVIISNSMAVLLKYDRAKIESGFYGFNGILIGASAIYFVQPNVYLFAVVPFFIIITFLLASVFENYMATAFNLPGLSLPFIISLYMLLIFLSNFEFIKYNSFAFNSSSIPNLAYPVKVYLYSMGIIVLQPDIISGLIITIAVIAFSRAMFLLSVISFASCYFFASLVPLKITETFLIVLGMNSILTSFALGGTLVLLSKKTIPLIIVSNVIVVFSAILFHKIVGSVHLPMLVLPFNFLVLSLIYSLKFRQEQSEFVLLYFKPGSSEENYYYHKNKSNRFKNFKYYLPELPVMGEWKISQGIAGEFTHKDDWQYAYDFVVCDASDQQFKNSGNEPKDYFAFSLPVTAPLGGYVHKVIDEIENNKIGEVNLENNWGNTVIIFHDKDFYSSISHLNKGSIKVKEGEYVNKGDIIGQCGNSGRSPFPHIHMQFQSAGMLGSKTLKYPFSHFIEKSDDSCVLKNFSYPEEGKLVQNIPAEGKFAKAFTFKYNDELIFRYELKNKSQIEKWLVKVDVYNQLFIENDKGDTAEIFYTGKVLFISNYIGKKDSVLYHFFLLCNQMPLCSIDKLSWQDEISVSSLKKTFFVYLSELFLPINGMISVTTKSILLEQENNMKKVKVNIEVVGEKLFKFYKNFLSGEVSIDKDGNVKEIEFVNKKNIFKAMLLERSNKNE